MSTPSAAPPASPSAVPGPTGRRWTDEEPLDPAWAPPARRYAPHRRSPWIVVGIVVLVIAALVLALVLAGGFAERTDRRIDAVAGQRVASGPFVFTFSKATAQKTTDYDGEVTWHVVAIGTVENTGDRSDSPDGSGPGAMFAAGDYQLGEAVDPDVAKISDSGGYTDASEVAPGLPAVSYRVEFDFPERYQPQQTVYLVVSQLRWGTPYVSSDEKGWMNGERSYIYTLPVTVLAPKDNS